MSAGNFPGSDDNSPPHLPQPPTLHSHIHSPPPGLRVRPQPENENGITYEHRPPLPVDPARRPFRPLFGWNARTAASVEYVGGIDHGRRHLRRSAALLRAAALGRLADERAMFIAQPAPVQPDAAAAAKTAQRH